MLDDRRIPEPLEVNLSFMCHVIQSRWVFNLSIIGNTCLEMKIVLSNKGVSNLTVNLSYSSSVFILGHRFCNCVLYVEGKGCPVICKAVTEGR